MSDDDPSKATRLFREEADGFERMIREVPGNVDSLDIAGIVRCYYQVMSMSSIIRALKSQSPGRGGAELAGQIAGIERQIRERFDCSIHPAIMSRISESADRQMASLRESRAGGKAGEDIEDEARLFERLRETMSTKEFVEQYDKGLGP